MSIVGGSLGINTDKTRDSENEETNKDMECSSKK